jgi:hypothetical protein
MKIALLALILTQTAIAGHPPKLTNPPKPEQTQSQQQQQGQNQGQEQGQQQVAEATNAGNTQSITYPRQAPSVAQGSLMVGGCGAGGNAGGSDSGGSAFLGFAVVTRDCKLLLAAAAYQSLGMYDAACEMVNGISSVKRRWKDLGAVPPSCEVKPPPPPETPPAVVVNVREGLGRDDLNAEGKRLEERQDRQVERGLGK